MDKLITDPGKAGVYRGIRDAWEFFLFVSTGSQVMGSGLILAWIRITSTG